MDTGELREMLARQVARHETCEPDRTWARMSCGLAVPAADQTPFRLGHVLDAIAVEIAELVEVAYEDGYADGVEAEPDEPPRVVDVVESL